MNRYEESLEKQNEQLRKQLGEAQVLIDGMQDCNELLFHATKTHNIPLLKYLVKRRECKEDKKYQHIKNPW